MKILFLGDTHGDISAWHDAIFTAKENEIGTIVQLGDFGYWEHTEKGYEFIQTVSMSLRLSNINGYFIDGNHENHTMLRHNYTETNDEGFVIVRQNLLYIPRGHRWVWDGVKFLGLGGAYSIDKNSRREGSSWWPEEMITTGEAYRAVEGGYVDVMLSHDAPAYVPLNRIIPGFFKDDQNTYQNRKLLQQVVEHTHPKRLFHGHYHHRYDFDLIDTWGRTKVVGLNCNNAYPEAYLVQKPWQFDRMIYIYDTENN